MLRFILSVLAIVGFASGASAAVIEQYAVTSFDRSNNHSIYISGAKYHFEPGARFEIYDDMTAALTGLALNDAKTSGFEVALSFENVRTTGNPKIEHKPPPPEGWRYMDLVAPSTLTGVGTAMGVLDLVSKPLDGTYTFQFGVNANGKNMNLGLSGWFFTQDTALSTPGNIVLSRPCNAGSVCDFNLDLHPIPLPAGQLLLPAGLAMLVALRRRRKAACAA